MLTCSHYDFFERSGFDVLTDGPGHWGYAQRLSRYITDPTTIRVRTIEQFGLSPSVDAIRKMRADWLGTIKRRSDAIGNYGTSRERKRAARRLAERGSMAPLPAPVVEAEPDLPSVAARGYMLHTAVDVIDACADACGISHGELIGTDRSVEFTRGRNLCAAVLRARGNSLPNVARLLGGRNHTTVMNAIERFFARDIQRPEVAKAWACLAPCVLKACRSAEELTAATAVRR